MRVLSDHSSLPWFRVRLKDGREVEIHSMDAIEIYRNEFASLVQAASESKTDHGPDAANASNVSPGDDFGVPSITTSKRTQDNLKALFETDWAKQGRTNAELTRALEVNAVPDKPNIVSKYLSRLVKANIVRRIKKDKVYHFYPLPRPRTSDSDIATP
jgi:hypothetical protein